MKTRLLLLALSVSASFVSSVSQNLIVNPGAESSLGAEWTIQSGNWISRTPDSGNHPFEGDYYFFAGAGAGSLELFQDVDVSSFAAAIDDGNQQFEYGGYMRSHNDNDQSRVIVEYRTTEGDVLESYDTGYIYNPNDWQHFTDTRTAPEGTRTIRIRLFSLRANGTNSDGYHDGLSLVALELLPVELISFRAFAAGNKVHLAWQTASEIDNHYFMVEKSSDGRHWITAGRVDGRGTSSKPISYSFTDSHPFQGTSYYRLRQTDFDGSANFSKTVAVTLTTSSESPLLFPNPVSTQFFVINLDIKKYNSLQVLDLQGRVVLESSDLNIPIDVTDLQTGSYFVKFIGATGSKAVEFLKN